MIRLFAAIETHPRLRRISAWLARLPLVGGVWEKLVDNPKELERFVKFAIVGIIGGVVDFTILNIMKLIFERVGLGVGLGGPLNPHQVQSIAANTISFSAAVVSNFTWNRLWTFPESRERPIGGQLARYAVVNVLGLGINTALLVVMDRYVFQNFFSVRLSMNLAKAFAIGVVLFWNFGVNRIWTYKGIK
ncbi:MAG: GtrA family protein [Anaerolineae bacterium]|nr:GtrA family protein [Anaerolineae bacterium]